MPPKSQAPLAPSDQALVDRAAPEKLVSLKKKDLNELVRTLRGRRDELGDAEPDQRRPIVKALRRAADERRARAEDTPPKPKKSARKADPGPQPVAEAPQPAPAPGGPAPGGDDSSAKAEREARKQQKEAERAAKQAANKAARKGGKSPE